LDKVFKDKDLLHITEEPDDYQLNQMIEVHSNQEKDKYNPKINFKSTKEKISFGETVTSF